MVVMEAKPEESRDEEYLRVLAPDEKKFTERVSFTGMPARVVTAFDTLFDHSR